MNHLQLFKDIVDMQKKGIHRGIYSVCSANEYVIRAAMKKAGELNDHILIEATANQVNQFGGYTGMKPADFRDFVYAIAQITGFPKERIILGGDHLGPLTWKKESSKTAMDKAAELISEYVKAGFAKIHIDTSMRLGNDRTDVPLDPRVIAERGAELCAVAEKTYGELRETEPEAVHPIYVIGSEVPVPGGAQSEDGIEITRPSGFSGTVELFKDSFRKMGLDNAWDHVIAVVVQPGVEFGEETVHEYDKAKARELCEELRKNPGLVFEGHSTDYQKAGSLKEMVEDGIAILKVGPALTFALREGLFLLGHIERELLEDLEGARLSGFAEALESSMLQNPENWEKYYRGSEREKKIARKYSLSDRCRYYLAVPQVKHSIEVLIGNLRSVEMNMSIIRQYFPVQYWRIRNGLLKNDPEEILIDKICDTIADYCFAIYPEAAVLNY